MSFVGQALVFVAIACLLALNVRGQEKRPYQAMGAPSNPQVAAQWNRYHDYGEATALLEQLAQAFPKQSRLASLGKSYGGREMWLMTITNFDGDESQKPAFWIDGGIHANEIQSVEVVLYTAWYLLEMRQRSETIRRLLDERVFYLVPMMSPDSRDAHFYQANTTHSPRSGQRPVDDDKDGLVDEDGPDDLDGDGHITQMRVRDSNGRWKSHQDHPELLVRVEGDEKGQFTLLGTEGFDNDGDGRVNEDGDGYYDPNRDWPWSWQPNYVQNGAVRYPLWVEENRLVADFVMAHPNIAGAQSYHNAGGMILRGPGAKSDRYEAADVRVYDEIGKQGATMLPGYRYMNVANELYEVWGGEFDWFHQMRGAFAFTNELFTPFNYFRSPEHEGFFGSRETQHLFDKYLLLGEGTVAWKEVDHPQYGKVEVGGMKKSWARQPPSFLLEEECHRNMAFTLYHADQMPLVKIQSADVKPLRESLFEVTAIVENQRLIPTHSAADLKHKITPPDEVSLAGDNVKVVLGMTANEPFFLQPEEQPRRAERMRLKNIPGNSVVYVRWIVQGPGPYSVDIASVKGGTDRLRTE
jgi:hypothetical protein